jgi:hypothetical protein
MVRLSLGEINSLQMMYSWTAAQIPAVQAGDYVWVDSISIFASNPGEPEFCYAAGHPHGFIVVGWGPIPDDDGDDRATCAEIWARSEDQHYTLDGQTLLPGPSQDRIDLYSTQRVNTVPYVVDFAGTTNGPQTQRPIPRPFFCSRADDPLLSGSADQFARHGWYFFLLPDQVSVTHDELFYPDNWKW